MREGEGRACAALYGFVVNRAKQGISNPSGDVYAMWLRMDSFARAGLVPTGLSRSVAVPRAGEPATLADLDAVECAQCSDLQCRLEGLCRSGKSAILAGAMRWETPAMERRIVLRWSTSLQGRRLPKPWVSNDQPNEEPERR